MSTATSAALGPDAPVDLRLSRYTSYAASGAVRREVVIDRLRPQWGWTSCRTTGHYPAPTPAKHVAEHGVFLDCACDVPCPRCKAGVGRGCTTLDGGGLSGGGYPTKTHAARVKVSPWCQQRLSGERTVCDTGEHDWQRQGEAEARCGVCGRVEQVQAELA